MMISPAPRFFARIVEAYDFEGDWVEVIVPCKSHELGAMPIETAHAELKARMAADDKFMAATQERWEKEFVEQHELVRSWTDTNAQLEYIQDDLEGRRLRSRDIVGREANWSN